MISIFQFYFGILLLSGFVSLNLAIFTRWIYWKKKHIRPANIFSLLLFAVALWAFGSALALIGPTAPFTYFWDQFKYLGIVFIPPAWALLAIIWTGREQWLTPTRKILLFLIPFITLGFVFTDSIHHLFWTSITYIPIEGFVTTQVIHGPAWWFFQIYSYLMIFIGSMLLIISMFEIGKRYQKQIFILLIGSFLPWIANIIYSFNLQSLYDIDFTPAAFVITGFIFLWGITTVKLVDIIPIARNTIFRLIEDPILVFDSQHRLLELNKKAEQLFQVSSEKNIGVTVQDIFHEFPEIITLIEKKEAGHIDIQLHTSIEKTQQYDAFITPLFSSNIFTGHIISLRDITQIKLADQALKESEEKFRSLTECSAVAIMIFQDNKWVYVNPAAEQILAYPKKELLSMNPWTFIHPESKDIIKHHEIINTEKKSCPSHRYEIQVVTKQNQSKWLDIQTVKIEYNKKKATLISAIDVTHQKEAEKTIRKQLAAITNSVDGIALINYKKEFTRVNKAFAKIYEYDSPDELTGTLWISLFNQEEQQRFQKEILPQIQEKGVWRGESVGQKKDGRRFTQEITVTAIEDGGMTCIVRDITHKKMLLHELEDAHQLLYTINKDLERKVKDRTEKIEQLIDQKDNFINQLGHDLKTPLTPMMVLLPMLKKKTNEPKELELFDVIIRNVHYMKELVDKTIDLAKLNSEKISFTFSKVDIAGIIQHVLQTNDIMLERHHITVDNQVTKPLYAEVDELRLEEVFNNLLTNAIKYSEKEGGIITIYASEDNELITFSIKDSGIGMTQEQIDRIFDEFFKADESRHELDSSGLGLAIAKKIITKHGGEIWAESEGKGKGSTFIFTLKKKREKNLESEQDEMASSEEKITL